MDDVRQDIRYALRGLRQKPLFAVIAILSIAIGVGANASIFSVVNALLLRAPKGIGEPERVVEVGRSNQGRGFDTFSYPEVLSMTKEVKSLDRVAATRDAPMSFTGPSGAGERVLGMAVGQPYFEAVGTTPFKGRFFLPEEDAVPGASSVAVVSHAFWRKQLGGRDDVIGSTIMLNRHAFRVVGVTQPSFNGHIPILPSDLYIPMTMFGIAKPGFDQFTSMQSSWVTVIARLAPGATPDKAQADIKTLFARLRQQYPEVYGNRDERSGKVASLSGVPAAGHGPITAFLGLLMALVVLVLLTTCANVAGMMIARAAGREREIAIRLAIGSGRSRLIRQLLIESVLVFMIGGAVGIMLSTWGLRAAAGIVLPVPVTLNLDFTPDMRVFLFGLTLTLATGVLFGLAPALQATNPNLVSSLKSEGSAAHSRGGRLRRVFVIAQVSLSLVLLISAGLFLRSLQRASDIDTGFDPSGVHLIGFDLSLDGYDDARGKEFLRALTERLSAAPGVTAAGVANDLPLDMGRRATGSYPEGKGEENVQADFNQVTPGYFEAVGLKLLQGRYFRPSDVPTGEKVIIVSKQYAATAWPGENPIGKRIRWDTNEADPKVVVGVVGNIKTKGVMDQDDPMLYLPQSQEYSSAVTLLVRTNRVGRDAAEFITREIGALDPNLSLTPVQTLEGVTSVGTLPQRMAAIITASLGTLALLLSGMGIYGVIAYMVTQRTREMGIRVAIGAKRMDLVGLVLKSGVRLALPGIIIGIMAALGLAQLMRAFILGVAPADPITFGVVPALLLAVIALATWVPAQRAARVSPMEALRSE